MHESMSSINHGEAAQWSPDVRPSRVEESLVHLDEVLAKAHKVSQDMIRRLDIVLQPEEPSEMKEGGVLPMIPASATVRRIEEAANSIEDLTRRIGRAMDRLDT